MSIRSLFVMRRALCRLVVALGIVVMASNPANAGPFADFFQAIRRSITHPEQKSRSHSKSHKKTNETPPSDAASPSSSGSAVSVPPNGKNTRAGTAASKKKSGKTDLRYGIPVPGRQGFVTSPFAPDSGYIDVRGFPPGTEVKDPYSGKVFLTP